MQDITGCARMFEKFTRHNISSIEVVSMLSLDPQPHKFLKIALTRVHYHYVPPTFYSV